MSKGRFSLLSIFFSRSVDPDTNRENELFLVGELLLFFSFRSIAMDFHPLLAILSSGCAEQVDNQLEYSMKKGCEGARVYPLGAYVLLGPALLCLCSCWFVGLCHPTFEHTDNEGLYKAHGLCTICCNCPRRTTFWPFLNPTLGLSLVNAVLLFPLLQSR